MPQVTASDATDFFHTHDEWLNGWIVRIEEAPSDFDDDGQFKWILVLDGDDLANGDETWAYSSRNFSVRSKAGQWYTAITGDSIDPGTTYDLNVFEGEPIQAFFEDYVKRDGNPGEKVVKLRGRKGDRLADGYEPAEGAF